MQVAVGVFGVGGEVVEVFVEEGDGAVGCCVGADFGAIGGRGGVSVGRRERGEGRRGERGRGEGGKWAGT